MVSPSAHRVSEHTRPQFNDEIKRQTEHNLQRLAHADRMAIDQRLRELDEEWDIERTLQANASSLILAGLLMGATVHKGFYVVPGVVAGFLLQHALQGWCPPLNIFRSMGVRTVEEIDRERYALKALRGDFANAPQSDPRSVLSATQM